MSFKIFVDLDGVLTNFDKALEKALGRPVKGDFGNDPKVWAAITNAGEEYWSEMEWMPDGHELWDAVEIYKPTILTAPTRHKSSVEGKKIWIRENLPPGTPFYIDQDKAKYADKDSILIDDREKNIKKWEEAGGIGILHKNTITTLDKLNKTLGSEGKEAMSIITDTLDNIANTLEFKGLIKKASQIDVISNTLEAGTLPHTKDKPAPIFSKDNPKVKDDKDHFPIPDAAHGRNALARVNQYGSVPSWYDGSLQELKDAVVKAVESKFPSVEVEEEKFEPAE